MTEKWPALRAVTEVFGWLRCLSRGQRHVAKGRYEQAVADFDRVIELGAATAWVFAGRGHVNKEMGRYDQALADFDRASELDPTEDVFAAARTEIRELTGRTDTDDALPSDRGTEAT